MKNVTQSQNPLLDGIEISYSRVGVKMVLAGVSFLLPLGHVVLSYSVIFKMCGLRTDNHSATRIDIKTYFVVGDAQRFLRTAGSIILVKNIMQSFILLKQLLIATMHCFLNLLSALRYFQSNIL